MIYQISLPGHHWMNALMNKDWIITKSSDRLIHLNRFLEKRKKNEQKREEKEAKKESKRELTQTSVIGSLVI